MSARGILGAVESCSPDTASRRPRASKRNDSSGPIPDPQAGRAGTGWERRDDVTGSEQSWGNLPLPKQLLYEEESETYFPRVEIQEPDPRSKPTCTGERVRHTTAMCPAVG